MNAASIKNFLYSFLLGSIIFYITTRIIPGIKVTGTILYWLMAYGVFFLANILVKQVLKFFTLPKNFFTFWLVSAILSFAAIYIMSAFLPGITVGATLLDPVGLGIISINPYTLTPILTMIAGGIVAGFLSAAFYWLASD